MNRGLKLATCAAFGGGVALCSLAIVGRIAPLSSAGDPQTVSRGAVASPLTAAAPAHSRPQPVQQSELARRAQAIGQLADASARQAAWVELLAELAETQPASAAAWAMRFDAAEVQRAALREVVQRWLALDPDAANAWLSTQAERLPAETVLVLARVVASFDVAPAVQLAQSLPAGLRASAISDVFGEWAAQNPWAAAHSAELLVAASDRVAAVSEVARLWAQAEPEAAFAWARELSDAQTQRVALDPLLASWVERDPAGAAAAVLQLPAEPGRGHDIDRVVAPWAQSDATAAFAWVSRLADSRERESAATTLLLQLQRSEPRQAADWARELSTGADGLLLEKIVTAWVARDAGAAATWARALPPSAANGSPLLELALARWQEQDQLAAQTWRRSHAGQP